MSCCCRKLISGFLRLPKLIIYRNISKAPQTKNSVNRWRRLYGRKCNFYFNTMDVILHLLYRDSTTFYRLLLTIPFAFRMGTQTIFSPFCVGKTSSRDRLQSDLRSSGGLTPSGRSFNDARSASGYCPRPCARHTRLTSVHMCNTITHAHVPKY